MKNITLAMVAVLAAVTMLSAVLAVPMQEANAEKRGDGDGRDGDGGGNSIRINQENECEDTAPNSCQNDAFVLAGQSIEED
jgi:predicted secreted protein